MSPAPFPPNALIGMVHVRALPGSPRGQLSIEQIVSIAADEARLLVETGFDAVIIENMHDRPYIHGEHGPETVAAMTRVGLAVREAARDLALGIQILSGGNREAVAIAAAVGASFIRCENFVFAHVADEGVLLRAEAGPLLRYRKQVRAEGVRIYADIKKKHASHAITADVSIAEAAEAAEFFGADGVIVTGAATGKPASLEDVAAVADATELPLLVGSGVTPESAASLLKCADGLIVGSAIKEGGLWSNPIDADRCRAMVEAVQRARD